MNIKESVVFPLAIAAAGAAAEALALELGTTVREHRDMTHQALEVDPRLAPVVDFFMTPYTDPPAWAEVHRIHHSVTDANLLPFAEVTDYDEWRTANQPSGHPDLPESFDNLDPVARQIPLQTVLEIGRRARELVKGQYTPEEEYTPNQAAEVLDTETKRYEYRDIKEKTKRATPKEWPEDEVIRLKDLDYLLRDPHSPSLLPGGASWSVFRKVMVPLYSGVERMFDSNDQLPDDLRRNRMQEWNREHRHEMMIALSTAQVLGAVAIGLIMGQRKPYQVVRNALIGGGIVAGGAYGLVKGGQLVNYAGHLGKDPAEAFRTGKITPHPDGSLATNANVELGWPTMDEAGWQYDHHNHPDRIDFSGGAGFRKAPTGYILQKLVDRRLLGLSPGKQFGGTDHRPDQLHPSVELLHLERARTLQEQAA